METERDEKVYPILVVCALIVRDGNVLMERHEDGKWNLPGGKVKINETPKNALVREMREQLNIEIDAYSLIEDMYNSYRDGGNWILATYRCNIISGIWATSETLDFKPTSSLSLHNTHAVDFIIIKEAMTGR